MFNPLPEAFDVSADLTELGRTEIAVVCAGAKSLLDIPKTLEFLVDRHNVGLLLVSLYPPPPEYYGNVGNAGSSSGWI